MQFTTAVDIKPQAFDISFRDNIILAGSCFAEEIGGYFVNNKFDTDVNPFGILYNPLSLEDAMRRLMSGAEFSEDDLFSHGGMYHSFAHHSRFSSDSAEGALEKMNARLRSSSLRLKNCNRLIITFGTAYAYRLKSDGKVVSNCHKLPSSMFVRERLNVEDIVGRWTALISGLRACNPHIRLIFTVSPIRHRQDGPVDNQISKSTLLLAADSILSSCPGYAAYFPSYEIMMDELRDYRYYAEDMLHPSPVAVEYIREKFRQAFFNRETEAVLAAWRPLSMALNHRPFNPRSESYRHFLQQTIMKMEEISEKFPLFDTSDERKKLQAKLDGFLSDNG
jgi:hypothetical protein